MYIACHLMCYLQFMNQREKLTLDSWILNEILDSLHFLVIFQEKVFILLSIVRGNKNEVVCFASSYLVSAIFLKIKAH